MCETLVFFTELIEFQRIGVKTFENGIQDFANRHNI